MLFLCFLIPIRAEPADTGLAVAAEQLAQSDQVPVVPEEFEWLPIHQEFEENVQLAALWLLAAAEVFNVFDFFFNDLLHLFFWENSCVHLVISTSR